MYGSPMATYANRGGRRKQLLSGQRLYALNQNIVTIFGTRQMLSTRHRNKTEQNIRCSCFSVFVYSLERAL